uniref:Transposase IS66 n=1 Tax=Cyanothece sp. (strain PCC 7425 / ATCC 29141) TaxID=395961 RepID=B8HZ16_CYAP4
MEPSDAHLAAMMVAPEFDPEEMGVRFWYEQYLRQRAENAELRRQLTQLEGEVEQLKETLRQLKERDSGNSSQPPSSDGYKRKSKGLMPRQRKQGPKYGHEGKTRHGFETVDHRLVLPLAECLVCGSALERDETTPAQRQQIAELVERPVEVWEYERPVYTCPLCGWHGSATLPLGCREDFSYGARLSSLVGWLGYGGHLSWAKQRDLIAIIFGIPLSQGSLAKMHRWFCESLYPSYESWWSLIQQPGVRCVDETSYRIDGVNYWMWVATSREVCVLFLAPSRSSAEVASLLGKSFEGILSSDCWSAYSPQQATAKQKCLAHIQRELEALSGSRFESNRQFASQVSAIFERARQAYRGYQAGNLTVEQLQTQRLILEAALTDVLNHPPKAGWAADAQALANRFHRYWSDWFTFLRMPEVKPDNNDAERALRPVVIHRKTSGGARSAWGGQLVSLMFSFLETMRLQGKNAVSELFNLLAGVERAPPQLLPSTAE